MVGLEEMLSLEIGEEWKGTAEDLEQLKWLTEFRRLTLIGPHVDDRLLECAGKLENLSVLTIKRARVTDQALARAGGAEGHKGEEAARAAIEMARLRQVLGQAPPGGAP